MKRFFDKAVKGNFKADPPPRLNQNSNSKPQETGSTSTSNGTNVNGNAATVIANSTRGLQPKDVVPAVPQPSPHAYLALLATKEGLLIRPHVGDGNTAQEPESYVRVQWSKGGAVEEMHPGDGEPLDWGESVVVYGIVGVLELFACTFLFSRRRGRDGSPAICAIGSYLLVITARTEVGSGASILAALHAGRDDDAAQCSTHGTRCTGCPA